jgi:RNA polymerase sigma-70 factor (ECF subfamily)
MESAIPVNDASLVAALRDGDEAAFMSLVEQYQPAMQRACRIFVRDPAIADEVVQDTWLDFLRGLPRFEGRSSLKTWLFAILTNNAKTRGKRESRTIVFSDLEDPEGGKGEPSVEPERFLPAHHQWAGHWALKPEPWDSSIEEAVLSKELVDAIEAEIELLPESQRAVISLRDISGWSPEEACNVLGLSETNQRVLLHRARSKIRRALEGYFDRKGNRA